MLITALPSSPRLVVIKITPLAPRTPNTAVADASFNTEMVATELMSTEFMGRSTPSTSTSGSLEFHDVTPRMVIFGSSSPGFPVVVMVTTPGRLPVRACPKLVTPPVRSKAFELVCAIAPTTEAFFCWPKPTTTTSSNCWLSSSNTTLIDF